MELGISLGGFSPAINKQINSIDEREEKDQINRKDKEGSYVFHPSVLTSAPTLNVAVLDISRPKYEKNKWYLSKAFVSLRT